MTSFLRRTDRTDGRTDGLSDPTPRACFRNWRCRKGPAMSNPETLGKGRIEMSVDTNFVFDTVICWTQ